MNRRSIRRVTLAALATVAATAFAQDGDSSTREGQRIDDRRREQPVTFDAWGRPVEFTGSWEFSDERRRNFDLNDAAARDRRVREHEVKLELRNRPANRTEVFVQAVGLHETRRTQGTPGRQRGQALERGQSWVRVEGVGGAPVQVQLGRVALIDRRSWWWDDDLDAARVQWVQGDWRVDTGLARELARVSSADRGIRPDLRGLTRWFGAAGWRYAPRHRLEAFWLVQRDGSGTPRVGSVARDEDATDPSDMRARWLGLRASGEWRAADNGPRLSYWADLATLRGRESLTGFSEDPDGRFVAGTSAQRVVRGHAVDLGVTAILPVALRPSLTVGYARGSGGERSAVRDDNFRQTGLHENKARLAGVKRLRFYGELLQPELSNLVVTTVATGIRVLDNSSIELVAHRYWQPVPSTDLPGARLSTDPGGIRGDIGRETDLVLALREWRQLELTFKWSRFVPGAAFPEDRRDPARAIEFGAALNF